MTERLKFAGLEWVPLNDSNAGTDRTLDALDALGVDDRLLKGELGGFALARRCVHSKNLPTLIRGVVNIPKGVNIDELVGMWSFDQRMEAVNTCLPFFIERFLLFSGISRNTVDGLIGNILNVLKTGPEMEPQSQSETASDESGGA